VKPASRGATVPHLQASSLRGFKRAEDTMRPLFAAVLSFNKEDTKSLVTSL
jgi:hypothetical protein